MIADRLTRADAKAACPHCGATLFVAFNAGRAKCQQCGRSFAYDDAFSSAVARRIITT
jgi:uncharacterized protein (DUF983 family)